MRRFILSIATPLAAVCAALPALAQDVPAPPTSTTEGTPADPAAASKARTTEAAPPRGTDTQAASTEATGKDYPRCSKTVTDSCKQRGA